MAKKPNSELERVVNSPETYVEKARLAAALELKNRGMANEEIEKLETELSTKFKAEYEVKLFESKLYSKNFIYLWAILITPLLIGLFMALNIWELGNRKGIWTVIGLSVLYFPVMIIILSILPEELDWLIGILHLAYAVFFVEWTWKAYLPTFEEYKNT
ncbi:MAG: hypothetical protein RID05_01850 [Cytophagales bacterium]